ncbi:RNA-directed DNA polymerase, eukaryota [Tanacetum coccineum]
MVGNTSTTRDSNGWYWKFKINKKDTSTPIRNSFQKEVEKIASSFYVTNFPDFVDAKRLWKECEPYRRIVDAFIANKRSKVGKRFRFVRFLGVKSDEQLARSLASIWKGSYHLFASVARFNRQEKKDLLPKTVVEKANNSLPTQKVEQVGSSQNNKSYASSLHGDANSKVDKHEIKRKHITLSDEELVQVTDPQDVALVKVKNVETMNNLYRLCREEGFDDLKIHHIGGMCLWLQFQNVESYIGMGGNIGASLMRLGVKCLQKSGISGGKIHVTIHGVDYQAYVQELGSWSINLDDSLYQENEINSKVDLVSNNDKDAISVSESDDEYKIQEALHVPHEAGKDQEACTHSNEVNIACEEVIPETQMDRNDNSSSLNLSRPPGFEHYKNSEQEHSLSSLQSKSGKCPTHTDKLKRNGIRGISVIHEMSRLIEINEDPFYKHPSLSRGRLGSLISVWDPNHFIKDQIWCDDWYIIIKGRSTTSDNVFYMINIYGPQETSEKITMWNRLLDFICNNEGHFVLFGDLNEVRDENKRYGTEFHRPLANNFNAFITDACLIELPLGGRNFTWMNKAGSKMSKLDRFLVSQHVTDIFPDIKVTALPHGWSDHSPILLHCDKIDYGPVPFKFFHSWLQREGFDDCLQKAYKECSITNPQMPFHEKLKRLKKTIKEWNHQARSTDMSRKLEIVRKLADIEEKINSNSALDTEKEDRVKLLKERDDLQHLEDMELMQKAKVIWDVEGDENTKFFHGLLKQKRSQQAVQGIMIDGNWVTNPHQVKTAFCNFYKEKFDNCDSLSDFSTVTPQHTLDHNDNLELEKNVSDDEIRLAVWDCGSQKAPGPDGFSFLFLKTYWDLLKDDVVRAVRGVFDSFEMPKGTNSSFITLIPKVANPIHVNDFWPISLIGMQYKIIAKVLANRLSKVIDKVVSKEQSAFISGRFILDGPLMLSEIMSWYKKKKRNLMLFKVDFEKAFDTVSWKFLDHIASVLVNGSPTSEFSIKRGLRQGDPLSPFLFIIVMEGLHIALKNAVSSGLIQGASIGESCYKISHLFYADDVVIISDWNRQDMINIIHVLHVFYLASGLKINVSKSNIYGLGMNPQDIEDMARVTRCGSDRFWARLSSWKANTLSIGGRLTLIKYRCGPPFSGEVVTRKKMSWIKWDNVMASFEKGGLNIGSIKAINLALLQKWRWHLVTNPDSIWAQWAMGYLYVFGKMLGMAVNWKRQIEGSHNEAALGSLVLDLGQVQLLDGPDSCRWSLDDDGIFFFHVMRLHIDSCMLPSCSPCTSWSKILPRKVNIFAWHLSLDRLPTQLNLSLRGLDIPSIIFPMCNDVVEEVDHVFFGCDLACDVWRLARRWTNLDMPSFSSWFDCF